MAVTVQPGFKVTKWKKNLSFFIATVNSIHNYLFYLLSQPVGLIWVRWSPAGVWLLCMWTETIQTSPFSPWCLLQRCCTGCRTDTQMLWWTKTTCKHFGLRTFKKYTVFKSSCETSKLAFIINWKHKLEVSAFRVLKFLFNWKVPWSEIVRWKSSLLILDLEQNFNFFKM